MSYIIFKNNNILKDLTDKDYRLLKFNNVNNQFHTFLMYSLIPNELSVLNYDQLNIVVDTFKKKINKYVKNKFNKNYINANTSNELSIFSGLCNLNIYMFKDTFNNLLLSTNNKSYKKGLYILNRNNEFYLLIKKNKLGFSTKLNNNLLKLFIGGGGEKRKEPNTTYFTQKEFFKSGYYDNQKIYNFLEENCKKLIDNNTKNKEKMNIYKEIIMAVFTDDMRKEILSSILNIERTINNYTDNIEVKIIIAGGSGFNNLLSPKNRPISPDIDVKLCLNTKEAIQLHKHMTSNVKVGSLAELKKLQIIVSRQLLIVRTRLFYAMKQETITLFNATIFGNKIQELNNMYNSLYEYCKKEFNNSQDIPFLSFIQRNDLFIPNQKNKVIVRETLMKRGIDKKKYTNNSNNSNNPNNPNKPNKPNEPYKLYDIFLYSFDLPFNGSTSYYSLAGILDVVVSIPGHIGYILPDYYNNTNIYTNDCYNINIAYAKYELIKLVTYGLRTQNRKISKDLVRFKLLLDLNPELEGATLQDIASIKEVLNNIKNNSFKNDLLILLDKVLNVGLTNPQKINTNPKNNISLIEEIEVNSIETEYNTQEQHTQNMFEKICKSPSIVSNTSYNTSSDLNTNYDTEYDKFNKDLNNYYEFKDELSIKQFADECLFYENEGGYSKQIGGTPIVDSTDIFSLSKVLQLIANDKSLGKKNITTDKCFESFLFFKNCKKIKLKENLNSKEFLKDTPAINFEKRTEYEAKNYKNNNNITENYFKDEYFSTKAQYNLAPFRVNKNNLNDIEKITEQLIKKINNKGINTLCYCYESYNLRPNEVNTPTEQEYAQFLLTQCQILNTYKETKKLYELIYKIANPPIPPSRVSPIQ